MNRHPARLLHESLLAAATDPALAHKTVAVIDGESHSYDDLLDSALRLAASLRGHGLERGDRVAIYMDNSWPCVVSIYAALLAGGVFLLINPQTKSDKLGFILDDSGAKLLLTDDHLSKEFLPVLARVTGLAAVISSGSVPAGHNIPSFGSVIDDSTPLAEAAATIPLDLAALIYTSGSTGNPKGVMQTHQSMMFAAGSLIQYLRLDHDDRILCVLPLAFDYGLYQLLMAVHLGATLVLERSFTYPAQVFARMQEFGVTVFPGVPTIFATLISLHQREPLCFAGVTRVTNTAAALADASASRLRDIFPNALLYKMYGLTECKRVSYLEPELAESKPGSVGKAIPGTEVYLLSADGHPTPVGETGILHVRGPHVMLGYWNRPDLSEQMLRPGKLPGERVLCTHDLFRVDADGYLYFVGRSDDIIKTRGEKVSPAEVENAMLAIAGIREVAVVGVPDALLGQAIRAYVVLEPETSLSSRQIRAQCITHLENFMVPQQIVLCTDLPRTATGKISKKALLEQMPPEDHA
ncbi:AMP-binding protein [Rhodanobacter sp. MP7CTX1]|uniref:class I adenylate-forming enzyme family protein n=1 Tax=Rhodanobacter sp. MP7CTX1 TaxID=2723084 RepID=UPI00161C21B2|nr:AMP-binding protein [Rhodanobacter sp. MP7CTX1]MBB6188332.1 amino acid adenylation domain-containing protein [Rhodanobacter sp. MP7CTX1]